LPIKAKENPADSPILSDDAGTFPPAASKMSSGSCATFPFRPFRPRGGQEGPRQLGVALPIVHRHRSTRDLCDPTAHSDHSLLQPDILAVLSCPHGFDLVAGVTSKSTVFPYHLQDLQHSIGIIGNGAGHCENWFDAILHRKIAIASSSSDDSPECLHVNEESKRQVTEKVSNKISSHRNRP
jgi:hypothetical protein